MDAEMKVKRWLKKAFKALIRFLIFFRIFMHKSIKTPFNENEIRKKILKSYEQRPLWKDGGFSPLLPTNKFDLSFIIPVYNSELYLERCIQSLVNQKCSYRYEIIFVNDGSSDNSGKILSKYANYENVKIVYQENSGISAARNKGLSLSEGEYIGFIDNDDYVSEYYAEKLLSRAYKKNADIVKCGHYRFNKYGIYAENTLNDESVSGYMADKINRFNGLIWEGITKKHIWNKVRFPDGFWYEDIITRIIVMRLCRQFEYINETLYYYNIHDKNGSKILWKTGDIKSLDQFFLIENLLNYSSSLGLKEEDGVYKLLLSELGEFLFVRTKGLSQDLREAVFKLACGLISEKGKTIGNVKLTYIEKKMEKAFLNADFNLWKLTSLHNSIR